MKKLIAVVIYSLLTTSIFSQLPSYVPTSRLQAWWSFSGNANDLSGNNYNGTVNGATLTTDRHNNINSAYYFDGNDWINIGDIDSLNPRLHDMTVSAWVKTTSVHSRIFSKGTHGGTQPGYAIMFYPGTGGKAAVIFSPGGHEHNGDRSNSTINNDAWHMVTGVIKRNGNTELYIDGVLQILTSSISHDASIDIASNTYNATIGVSYCNFGTPNLLNEFFVGKIDEVGVWRRALTQCEITQLYNESLFPAITVNSGSICSGGSFTMIPSGASTYTFEGGNSVVSPTASINYTVIGTNSLGCVVSGYATASITVNPNPTVTVNSGNLCTGSNFTINPSGASTYTIEGGNAVVNPTANTSYTVIGTSSLGCLSANTATSNITVIALPTVAVNNGTICSGSTFTIVPSGAATYTIEGGNSVVSPTANATYSVIGTSLLGCLSSNTATSNVTVNALPVVSVNNGTICSGNSFTIIPGGANTYTIEGGSTVVSPTTNASYTVVGTSTAGCVSVLSATSNITVNANPTITAVSNQTLCLGNNFTLTPSGGTSYTVTQGVSLPASFISSIVITPIAGLNIYTVTGTNSLSCSGSNTLSTLVNPNPNVTAFTSATNFICVGQSATLTASGANNYTWNPGGIGNSIVINPTVTANYTVTGVDANGCENTAVLSQSVSACSGLNESNYSSLVQIYPNPVNEILNINFASLDLTDLRI
jgi:hypothetical protein